MHVSLKVLLGVDRKDGAVVYEQPGEVVEVEDDFGNEMILNGWAEAVEAPPPPPEAAPARRGRPPAK